MTITNCVNWSGSKTKEGYGIDRNNGLFRYAHRVIWEDVNGKIPKGLVIRHLCNNPSCVNLSHLALGTHADNVNDRVVSGNSAVCEKNGRAKLNTEQVVDIYTNKGATNAQMSRKYGVSERAISLIRGNINWITVTKDL